MLKTSAPLNAIDNQVLAQLFKASADSLRVDILRVLHNNSFSVQELCQILDIKQPGLSHHLKILATADLVTTRREGNNLYYRRNLWPHDHALANLQRAIFYSVDQCELSSAMQAGIATVEQQRVQSSNQFFLENAGKFRQQQDLIAQFEQYAESVANMLDIIALPARQHAIEIGPGEGLFLPYLAKIFAKTTAVDTSAAMLLQCERLLKQQKITTVQTLLGDTRCALKQQLKADAIVINMVLHHIATPSDVFNDAYQLLNPNGALIVTELCPHDQAWAKEACGDVWLGFEPEDLSNWAKSAGFFEGESSFLAQRNGFRIQIRYFYKPEEL